MSTGLVARLAELRQIAGISTRQASLLAGLSHSTLGHHETGIVSAMSLDTLRAVAKLFGVSLDYLLTGEGDPPDADRVRASVEAARTRYEATGTEG